MMIIKSGAMLPLDVEGFGKLSAEYQHDMMMRINAKLDQIQKGRHN